MEKVETAEYGGFVWRRYPESKRKSDREYFKRTMGDGRPVFLHRYVYETERGPIPDGWHVHHKDENRQNNSIENLECLSPEDHRAEHEPWGGDRERMLSHLERVRPLTKAWHSSPEGLAKHREIGAKSWDGFVGEQLCCKQCGTQFVAKTLGSRDKFCSNACKSAWRRAEGLDNVTKPCEWCGELFTSNKYTKVRFCCRSCANRGRNK